VSADGLLAIYQYADDLLAEEPELRRLACPNDGTPYLSGPNGELYCPHDGYRPQDV
jgi:uncharacterized Zn finger protein (UPF0148 family)